MSNDLDRIIADLEALTGRMLATTCWDQTGDFARLSASRRAIAAMLVERKDLDQRAAERISAVIQSGNSLAARVMAMRESVLTSIAEAETGQSFTRELGAIVPTQARVYRLDVSA